MCVNLGLVLALTMDSKAMLTVIGDSPRRSSAVPIQAFLIASIRPELSLDSARAPVSKLLRIIRVVVPPTERANFDDDAATVGNRVWTTSIASAISTVSPELEETRLRSVYRERIRYHFGLHLGISLIKLDPPCTVSLLQDRSGEILEVTVEQCHASAQAQNEFVAGIRQAGPLPPPPRPDLFESRFQLSIGQGIDVQLQ